MSRPAARVQKNLFVNSAKIEKGRSARAPPFDSHTTNLLLRWGDHVLGGLGHAELDYGLGLDLDGCAGLGVAADARLALRLDEPADAGDDENAVLLGFLEIGRASCTQRLYPLR